MKGLAYIKTFGCQMNVRDSERMLGLLMEEGYGPADAPEHADVLLVNTCSVREKPEQKVFGVLGRWKRLKDENPSRIIGVCGCVAQQKGEQFLDRFPHLDLVVGTRMVHQLPELVERARNGERIAAVDMPGLEEEPLFRGPEKALPGKVSAFISIMQGCDNFCSFCIVPHVRGPQVSRPAEEVICEAERMAASGVREVTLLGQNVNAYQYKGVDFPSLLRMTAEVEGLLRIRFTTSHPRDLEDRLIEVMASHPKVMEHIHLPVQAGSDRVLAAMGRGYTREHYLSLVEKLRKAMPEVGITADLIVGFPGETEEDFQDTLSLLKEVRFDETFSFRYSPRPGTPAAELPDQVPEEEKYERLYRLQALQAEITEEKNRELVGTVQEALAEGESKTDPEKLSGRTRTNRIVHFPRSSGRPGELIKIKITRALKHSLEGERAD